MVWSSAVSRCSVRDSQPAIGSRSRCSSVRSSVDGRARISATVAGVRSQRTGRGAGTARVSRRGAAAAPAAGAASCAAACGGRVSGSCSRTGIGSVPADDDDAAERLLERPGGLGALGGRAGDHAAQEPARAVDAEEPRRAADRLRAVGCPGLRRRRRPGSCRPARGRTGPPPRAATRPGRTRWSRRSARTPSQMPAARGAANAATCSSESPARSVAPTTFCCGLSSTRRSVPGSAGSRMDPRSTRAPRRPARPPRPTGRVVSTTSRSRCCGSGGTPRSRRLRSIRLRRRPNGMSAPPFEQVRRPGPRPVPAGRAVPARAALAVGQLVDRHEAGAHDRLDDQLRDPVAAAQGDAASWGRG